MLSQILRVLLVVLSFASLAGVAVGALLLTSLAEAQSAPQEAAIASLACSVAILPYVAMRAVAQICKTVDLHC
jgi:hypothetical protein